MASSFGSADQTTPAGRIITRGFAAAHGAFRGTVYLTLLYAPLQIVGAILYGLQAGQASATDRSPDASQLMWSLAAAGVGFLLFVAVFFLFPFFQGGILGQVRDRLESSDTTPGPYGTYARANYARLLGSQAVFTLMMMAAVFPLICLGAVLALQEIPGPTDPPPPPGEMERQLLSHPIFLTGMVLVSVLSSAVGMIYWVANCIVVAEGKAVGASWRRSFRFCRRNLPAVLAVGLLNLVVGLALSPLGMLGQLGIVTNTWVLSAVALVYSGLIGYWAVILAGLSMSLYLGRRAQARTSEAAVPVAVGI